MSKRSESAAAVRPRRSPDPAFPQGDLSMRPGPLRADCWNALGPTLREKLSGASGDVVEWVATYRDDGMRRLYSALVLGRRGAVFAEPRVTAEGRVVHDVHTYVFADEAPRARAVRSRGAQASTSVRSAPGTRQALEAGSQAVEHDIRELEGVSSDVAEDLGALPFEAQRLMAAPFLAAADPRERRVLRSFSYYEGTDEALDVFVAVLAGRSVLTAAIGRETRASRGPRGPASHWDLTCHRFSVVRRRGR